METNNVDTNDQKLESTTKTPVFGVQSPWFHLKTRNYGCLLHTYLLSSKLTGLPQDLAKHGSDETYQQLHTNYEREMKDW